MFLSIFKMMLNEERCSVLPSSTVYQIPVLQHFLGGLHESFVLHFFDPDPKHCHKIPDPECWSCNYGTVTPTILSVCLIMMC